MKLHTIFKLEKDGSFVPVDIEELNERYFDSLEHENRLIVSSYSLVDNIFISTVFDCFNQSFGLFEPRLFETMVFNISNGNYQEDMRETYSNIKDAIIGHFQIVKKYGEKFMFAHKFGPIAKGIYESPEFIIYEVLNI